MNQPFSDPLGTVRGGEPWVLVSVVFDNDNKNQPWVSVLSGERVSHYVMAIMDLPVIGAVPGSPADSPSQRRVVLDRGGDL
jgi:hypothetical protein